MALIIEDGTGISNADSYQALADARVLAASYGIKLPTDDTEAEVSLRQGYRNLLTQESTLQGSRTHSAQNNIYPRSSVYSNCTLVDSSTIPDDVKFAQLYAAEAISGGYSQNSVNTGQELASFNVDGVYSESYQDGSRTKTNATIQGVVNSLYPLTKAGYAASPCGSSGGLYRDNVWPCNNGYKGI